MSRKSKRKLRNQSKSLKVVSPEEREASLVAKLEKFKKLQDRREQNRFVQLLKSAEDKVNAAQIRKAMALKEIEEAQEGIKEAESYMEIIAQQVAAWEEEGLIHQKALVPIAAGVDVVVSHQSAGLGVVPWTDDKDPRWVYGKARNSGEAGAIVEVLKSHAAIPDFGEETVRETAGETEETNAVEIAGVEHVEKLGVVDEAGVVS